VRVLEIARDREKVGFSYGTLAGHPLTGVNEFSFVVEKNSTYVIVHTTARPAHIFATFIGPVFNRSLRSPLQPAGCALHEEKVYFRQQRCLAVIHLLARNPASSPYKPVIFQKACRQARVRACAHEQLRLLRL
jgi:hypothetical protein